MKNYETGEEIPREKIDRMIDEILDRNRIIYDRLAEI